MTGALRFEGNTLHRLLPDGSGPTTINLSSYKRIFVIALGKAAGPMLETLLDRMKRRKGLRGICCYNQIPKNRNWRFRYFEGGHPLPNEDTFAAARAALALLKRAKKDTLIFFLISGGGSAMFDLPLDPQITLEDTIAVPPGAACLGRAHQRDQHPAQAFFRGQGRTAGHGRAGSSQGHPAAARRAAAHAGRALLRAHVARSLHCWRKCASCLPGTTWQRKFPPSVRAFFEREDLPESPGNKGWRPPFFPKLPKAESVPARQRHGCRQ